MPIPKVIAEIKIIVHDNGNVDYQGPLNDVMFVTDILNKAQRAVLNHFIEIRQKETSKIHVPDIILPNDFKNKVGGRVH